jgi:hypothetical protein
VFTRSSETRQWINHGLRQCWSTKPALIRGTATVDGAVMLIAGVAFCLMSRHDQLVVAQDYSQLENR